MSTRCNIRFIREETNETLSILYHHYDGYPSGVGTDLLTRIGKMAAEAGNAWKKNQVSYLEFLNSLLKDTGDEYEQTDQLHGDIEYLYTIVVSWDGYIQEVICEDGYMNDEGWVVGKTCPIPKSTD